MKYLLLMYANEASDTGASQEELSQTWAGFRHELAQAGVLLSSNGVVPGTQVTTVRVRENQTLLTDGPFAETHEQMGGYFVLDCQDLEEAIRWAEKIPTAKYGSIEVRPLWSPG